MISRQEVKDPKKRILTACVRMFIERGFKQSTMMDIIKEADVSAGTFQNAFRTKDGVLSALVEYMFDNQFAMARSALNGNDGVTVYAVETAMQLAITECNEKLARNLRRGVHTIGYLRIYMSQDGAGKRQVFPHVQPRLDGRRLLRGGTRLVGNDAVVYDAAVRHVLYPSQKDRAVFAHGV